MSTPIERAAEVIHEDAPHLAHNALGTHTTAREALSAALNVDEMARVLFAWNTGQNPYFVIRGRLDGTREPGQDDDPYLPIAHALRAHILGGAS